MRLRNTAGELEGLGEDADGAAESITKLQTQILNLTGGKVNIMSDADTFKSTYQIMQELASVWNDLSDVAQADITRLVAGTRQGNALNAMLTNMSAASEAATTALKSSGSAVAENEKYLDSIQGKIAEFNAEWEALSKNTIDSDLVTGVIDFGTAILAAGNNIGGLEVPLTLILGLITAIQSKNILETVISTGAAVGNFGKKILSFAKDIISLTNTTSLYAQEISDAIQDGFDDIEDAADSASSAIKIVSDNTTEAAQSAQSASPSMRKLSSAFSILSLVITGVVVGIQLYNQHMEEMRRQAIETLDSFSEFSATMSDYESQIKDLTDTLADETTSQKEAYEARRKLLEIQKQIIGSYGDEVGAINLVTNATNDSVSAALKAAKVREAQRVEAETIGQVNDARDELSKKARSSLFAYDENDQTLSSIMQKYGGQFEEREYNDIWLFSGTTTERIKTLTDLSTELAKYGDKYEALRIDIAAKIQGLNTETYQDYQEMYDSYFTNVKVVLDEGYGQLYDAINEAATEFDEALIENNKDKMREALTKMLDLSDVIPEITGGDSVDVGQFEKLFEPYQTYINSARFEKDINDLSKDVQSAIKTAIERIQGEQTGALNDIALGSLLSEYSIKSDGSATTAGIQTLTSLCEEYNLTVDSLVDSLVELGYVQKDTFAQEQAVETIQAKKTAAIEAAIKDYNQQIEAANRLYALQKTSPNGVITGVDFDNLVKSGSEMVSVLEQYHDELGNVQGWKISESAMEQFISDQFEAADKILATNDALSEQYAKLAWYSGTNGSAAEQIATYAEKIETLGDAYKKAAQDEQFTLAEMQKLKNEYPDLSFEIDGVTGKYNLQTDSVLSLVDVYYGLIKSMKQVRLEMVKMNNVANMQSQWSNWSDELIKKSLDFIAQNIEESGAATVDDLISYLGVTKLGEAQDKFAEEYIAAREELLKIQEEYDTLQATTAERWQKEADEAASNNSETQFEKLKKQLDMERSAFEAGVTLDPQFLQFNLQTMSDYYNELARIAKNGYKAQELDAVEYQNYIIEAMQGLGKYDTYESRTSQLDLEKEALDAQYTLEDEYRKYNITSDREYWETKQQLARDAYRKGEIDANEYQRVVIKAYSSLRDVAAEEFSDSLSKLNNEKKKIEAGMAWDTSVLVNLEDYYNKFEQINEERYAQSLITAEEYVDSLIEIFQGRNNLLTDTLNDYEHDIYLLEKNSEKTPDLYSRTQQTNNAKIIATYEMMQRIVHEAAENYRAEMSGVMSDVEIEHSEFIQNLQKQWWSYQDSIDDINESMFSDTLDAYNSYISRHNKFTIWGTDNEIAAYGRALQFLKQSYDNDLIDYKRYLNEKISLLESMYDAEEARQQAYVDAAVKALEKEKEALEEQLQALEDHKGYYETSVSTVVDVIDERIKALQEENDELDKQIELQKALEALELAKSQRNKRVFVEGVGFEWMADEQAIKEAQENYDDLKKKAEFNAEIEALEAYKKAWQDTVDSYEKSRNEQITAQILGNNWQEQLSQQMVEIINRGADGIAYVHELQSGEMASFAQSYASICDQLDEKIEGSTAAQIRQTEEMINKWNEALETITTNYEQYEGLTEWIEKFEGESYANRLQMLDNFVNESSGRLQQLRADAAAATLALASLDGVESGHLGDTSSGKMAEIVSKMQANSAAWFSADDKSRKELEDENAFLGSQLGWTRDDATGIWYNKYGLRAYAHGGVVDTTGLAMLHGQPNKAETVFNATDSAKLYEYVHSVPNLVQDLISRVNMNPVINKSGDNETTVSIKEIHLHDVQNTDGLADAIVRTLPLKLTQRLNKNR